MGFSLTHYFNETVATELNKAFHSEHWILLFLTPNIFLSDNESEFNEFFREIDENI